MITENLWLLQFLAKDSKGVERRVAPHLKNGRRVVPYVLRLRDEIRDCPRALLLKGGWHTHSEMGYPPRVIAS